MAHAGRVCDDGIRDEGRIGSLVALGTRLPAAFQHFAEHVSLSADVAGFDAGETGDQAGVLDNVCHELRRITSQGIELQTSRADEVFEDTVSCEADSVVVVAL